MSNIIHVTDDQFEEKVLQAKIPVLVDFGLSGVVHVKQLHLYSMIFPKTMMAS